MKRPAGPEGAAVNGERRITGIPAIGAVSWGTHFCHFYEQRQDLLDIAIPYFRAGLAHNEFCLWIACEPSDSERARQELRAALPDANEHLRRGDIEIIDCEEWYLLRGEFDPERVRAGWLRKLEAALARGYEGMRVHANEAWLTRKLWQAFAEYESTLNGSLSGNRMIVMCTYPLAGSTGAEIFDVARTHDFALARRAGEWEVLETVELVAAKAEVLRLNAELEERVRERTRELEQAAAALRESEAKLEEAERLVHLGYWENDLQADRITWSDETYRILGLEPGEITPSLADFRRRIHPDDRPRQQEATERAHDGDGTYDVEYRVIRPDGEVRTIHSLGEVRRDASGRPTRAFGVVQDVTDRRRSSEALALFRTLLDHTHDIIEVADPATGRFLDVNRQACLAHGYTREELLALSVPDLDPGLTREGWSTVVEEIRRAGSRMVESVHRRKDGSEFPVEVSVTFVSLDRDYLLAVVRDITERKALEGQFWQSQKMEAIGRLAGGVAHDFNNLLTAILGYAELLMQDMPPGSPAVADVEEIRIAAERAHGVTRQMLAFSRRQILQPRLVDVGATLGGIERMLRLLLREDVHFEVHGCTRPLPVRVDPIQLEQVLMNLVVNARDATAPGGRITVECGFSAHAPGDSDAGPAGRGYARVVVSDTGTGMAPEILSRIFEPFFTTKAAGTGTGLGLSTVLGIVRQSGGHVSVDSEPGRGTRFTVLLPLAAEEAEEADTERPAPTEVPVSGKRVVVVEDEDAVRHFVVDTLQRNGMEVVAFATADEAAAVLEDGDRPFDVLLTDVVLPGTSGPDLVRRVRGVRPGVGVIYMSGYSEEEAPFAEQIRHAPILEKPFGAGDLLERIRSALA